MTAIPIEFKGKLYASVKELALAFGVKRQLVYKRLAAGKSLDACLDLKPARRRPTVVAGVEYRSIEAAAQAYNFYAGSIIYRMNNGWTPDQAFGISAPPRTDKCSGIVYIITNSVNRKKYIGVTTTGIEVRWSAHKRAAERGKTGKLYEAMRTIGVHKFKIQVLVETNSRSELADLEAQYIAKYKSILKGYNVATGGTWCGHGDTQIEIDGQIFHDVNAVASYVGVHPATIRRRMRLGFPVLAPSREAA